MQNVPCETIRELTSDERLYIHNPKGMAGYHWQVTGEMNSPYKHGSDEARAYIDEYVYLDRLFDQAI